MIFDNFHSTETMPSNETPLRSIIAMAEDTIIHLHQFIIPTTLAACQYRSLLDLIRTKIIPRKKLIFFGTTKMIWVLNGGQFSFVSKGLSLNIIVNHKILSHQGITETTSLYSMTRRVK
ncbi:hypothetical protein CJF30_00010827 [Rutstroemia sp. NJR-2017a BBW]|nr:hypothetical protein CJF30_00010827 [Rutstroemia sp. NJR-2017a BBW]